MSLLAGEETSLVGDHGEGEMDEGEDGGFSLFDLFAADLERKKLSLEEVVQR
jgi:hypothetical protein